MISTNIIDDLARNPIIGFVSTIVGLLLGVVGLLASWYFYRKSKAIRRANHLIGSYQILGPDGALRDHLQMSYKGYPVPSLTVSKVCIWNSGTVVLNRDDVAPKDPVRICEKGGRILDAEIIYQSDPISGVTVEQYSPDGRESWVNVDFDYIEPGKGFIVRVVHTGLGSAALQIAGTFKGSGPIKEEHPLDVAIKNRRSTTLIVLCFGVVAIWSLVFPMRGHPNVSEIFAVTSALLGLGYSVMPRDLFKGFTMSSDLEKALKEVE